MNTFSETYCNRDYITHYIIIVSYFLVRVIVCYIFGERLHYLKSFQKYCYELLNIVGVCFNSISLWRRCFLSDVWYCMYICSSITNSRLLNLVFVRILLLLGLMMVLCIFWFIPFYFCRFAFVDAGYSIVVYKKSDDDSFHRLAHLSQHKSRVMDLLIVPDNTSLVSCGKEGLLVWSLSSFQCTHCIS